MRDLDKSLESDQTTVAFRFFALAADGTIRSHNGDLTWPAPKGKPGRWVTHDGPCVLCQSGLHGSLMVYDALQNRQGTELGTVEAQEIVANDVSKFSARRMRLVALHSRKKLVALAGLAAALSLKYFEERYPNDKRPRQAIESVIRWVEEVTPAAAAAAAWRSAAAAAADAAAAAAWRQQFDSHARKLLAMPDDDMGGYLRALLNPVEVGHA